MMSRAAVSFLLAALMLPGATAVDAKPAPRQQQATNSCDAAPPASLKDLLHANPNGGDALSAAIADAVRGDASAAAAVIALAKMANPEQKAAIAIGLVRALQGADPDKARVIKAALGCSDPVTGAMVASLQNQNYAEAGGSNGGSTFFSPGGGGFGPGGALGGGGGIFVSPN